ncbi:hypothetical protein GOBAR_AA37302 [Gossypium barbadense]|uniref:Uncharacterized protein n=1 Tax=Gossypium barbadense TaxID=3634 RepID=A0A2P5VX80_GOSBA|nr:hypothetical protein GOBAR_AA37302 [Gossypium barbadense]
MTIATTRYNILLAQDLWTNEPLPPPEYPPPLSSLPWPIILHNSNSMSPFISQEVLLEDLNWVHIVWGQQDFCFCLAEKPKVCVFVYGIQ